MHKGVGRTFSSSRILEAVKKVDITVIKSKPLSLKKPRDRTRRNEK